MIEVSAEFDKGAALAAFKRYRLAVIADNAVSARIKKLDNRRHDLEAERTRARGELDEAHRALNDFAQGRSA